MLKLFPYIKQKWTNPALIQQQRRLWKMGFGAKRVHVQWSRIINQVERKKRTISDVKWKLWKEIKWSRRLEKKWDNKNSLVC